MPTPRATCSSMCCARSARRANSDSSAPRATSSAPSSNLSIPAWARLSSIRRRVRRASWLVPTTISASPTPPPAGIEQVEAEGKTVRRGLGDQLGSDAVRRLHEATFFGGDVDPRMVRLATMNLTLRGPRRSAHREPATRSPAPSTARRGRSSTFQAQGFDVILANPPFSGRLDTDRIVEEVKVGRTAQTELLFLQHMLNQLKNDRRCGVVVPEGVLFGSTSAHRELRRRLVENNTLDAVLSLPGASSTPIRASRPRCSCSARAVRPNE